ncbi:hypothetical protein NX059_010806 [Plenodomus lindquistii]|nr:hypothetical protein NX059_010806 [Plenodomus lindquistii]
MFTKTSTLLILLTTTLSLPVYAATICGFVGTHDTNALTQYMGNFFYNGPSSFALCAAWCKNDAANCQAFRYSYYSDSNSQYCEFFNGALDGRVEADSTSPYYYYDIACGFPAFGDGGGTVTTTVTNGGDGYSNHNNYSTNNAYCTSDGYSNCDFTADHYDYIRPDIDTGADADAYGCEADGDYDEECDSICNKNSL